MKIRVFSLISIVFVAYVSILWHDFLYEWDDHWVVINRYTDAGLNVGNLWAVFTEFHQGQYAPFNELNYILIYAIFGYNPMAFHAVSILWHGINTTLVFLFLDRLLRMVLNKNVKFLSSNMAWLCALLWAVHPVNVEPVSWISASKILVYACYYLSALLLYIYYVEQPSVGKYISLLLLFISSFFGKEQAVVLPLAFLSVDYIIKRRRGIIFLLIEKAPFFILSIFFGVLTIISQGNGDGLPNYVLWQRLLFCCYSLYEYMVKTILPMNLIYLYPFPIAPGNKMLLTMYAYPIMVLAAVYIVYLLRKNRILTFGLLFFVIHLLVALHLISISRFAIVADRYNYLAMIGPLLIISYYLCLWYQKNKIPTRITFVGYFAYFCIYTLIYKQNWDTSEHVKQHVVELIESQKEFK